MESVSEMLKERHAALQQLKHQLIRAQDRMKKFAGKSRSERTFHTGDWVYLKLQPYRQVSLSHKGNAKLHPRYYGPFEMGWYLSLQTQLASWVPDSSCLSCVSTQEEGRWGQWDLFDSE